MKTPGKGPSLRHEDAIARLTPNIQRRGLSAALHHLGVNLDETGRLAPDAFDLREDSKTLVLYEVVVRSDISLAKFKKLRVLRDRLAAIGWSIEVWSAHAADRRMCLMDIDTESLHASEVAKSLAIINTLGQSRS